MAKMAAETACVRTPSSSSSSSNAYSFSSNWKASTRRTKLQSCPFHPTIRASHSMDDKNKVYKELGMFALRKKIEDVVLRAEVFAPTALELEEAKCIRQEEIVREYDLWDDLTKSNAILVKLADSTKVVDALKDLRYKAEEAKLITHLADMDAINHRLFKQAHTASIDISKFLDKYEMSKLLRGPYDQEGACMIIKVGTTGIYPEIWAEQLLRMYMRWAEKQGYGGRVVEKCPSENGGIKSATIEFESKCAYGNLSGERGVHRMISSHNESVIHEASLAAVDVIPLYLETSPDLLIPDEELLFSSPSSCGKELSRAKYAVSIQHLPTGLRVQSSGERSHFANKMKALNRLKAKLLVVLGDQAISDVRKISSDAIVDIWNQETRRYVLHPQKLVQDVKTGFQVPDLNSVLDGNIEPLIVANINSRQACDMV